MKIKNKKTAFIAGFFAISLLLTACGNNSNTDIRDPQREQEETAPKDAGLQEAIDVFMSDTIPFIDGTAASKNDASWGSVFEYDDGEKNSVLGFDFAFMRYALPIYSDTDADPDLYDFEDSDYSIVNLWSNIEGAEFFKVTASQKLENGLTVSKAFCTVPAVFDDGAHIRVNEIYLEGSITAEGVLEYYGQDEYILPEGSVLFYPDPLSCGNLPVSYDDTLCTAGSVDINGELAFRNDGARFYVGNINEIDTDISDYFEHKTLVKVKATLSDIILRYDENTGGNVSSAVLKEVELQDKSNFNNTNSVSTETAPSEEAAAQSRGEKETKLYHTLEDAEIDTKKIRQLTGEELKSVDFTDCTIAVLDNYGVKIYDRLSDEKAKEFIDCIIQAEINSDEYGELPEKNGGTTYEFQITLNTNEQIYVGTLRAEDNDLIVINGNHGYPCDEETSDQIRECYQEIYKRFAEKAWQQ